MSIAAITNSLPQASFCASLCHVYDGSPFNLHQVFLPCITTLSLQQASSTFLQG